MGHAASDESEPRRHKRSAHHSHIGDVLLVSLLDLTVFLGRDGFPDGVGRRVASFPGCIGMRPGRVDRAMLLQLPFHDSDSPVRYTARPAERVDARVLKIRSPTGSWGIGPLSFELRRMPAAVGGSVVVPRGLQPLSTVCAPYEAAE
jgi:hypothetical protein